MIFNSINFFIFFIITTIAYYVVKDKYQYIILLISSYFFYGYSNINNIFILLFITLISYFSVLAMEKKNNNEKKKILIFSVILIIATLLYFKYFSFIIKNINALFSKNINIGNIIIPLGISFFTLQAITYIVDTYRKDVLITKNFLKYACFISFFPCILSGPILKSKEALSQFDKSHSFNYKNFKDGFIYILLGLFKKVVIADLIAIGVNNVYSNLNNYSGIQLIIVIILYSFQIYFDFSSYSNIAYGCSKILDFNITKNFNSPYFANNIKNFWSRWHIALSTWFKDYVYIPLGGNRKGKFKTYINLMIVFIVSGLWHGAAWTYIFWGFLHGLYQIIERKLNIKFKHNFINVIINFVLVTIAWVFFRSSSMRDAIYVLTNIFKLNFTGIISQLITIGFDKFDYIIIILSTSFIMILEYLNIKFNILEKFENSSLFIRLSIYILIFFIIMIFGQYGPGFNNSQFIYLGF